MYNSILPFFFFCWISTNFLLFPIKIELIEPTIRGSSIIIIIVIILLRSLIVKSIPAKVILDAHLIFCHALNCMWNAIHSKQKYFFQVIKRQFSNKDKIHGILHFTQVFTILALAGSGGAIKKYLHSLNIFDMEMDVLVVETKSQIILK